MEQINKDAIVGVISEILRQYIEKLKIILKQREKKALLSAKYDEKIDMIAKSIVYSERLLNNISQILFREEKFSQEELFRFFYNFSPVVDRLVANWELTENEEVIRNNIKEVLNSVSIDEFAVLPVIMGYSKERAVDEYVNKRKWDNKKDMFSVGALLTHHIPNPKQRIIVDIKPGFVLDLSYIYDKVKDYLEDRFNNDKYGRYNRYNTIPEYICNLSELMIPDKMSNSTNTIARLQENDVYRNILKYLSEYRELRDEYKSTDSNPSM